MSELSFNLPEKGEARSAADAKVREGLSKTKEVVNGKIGTANIETEGVETGDLKNEAVTRAKMAKESKPVTWYTPKIIATEEVRENVSFGTLTTADEIKEIVVPENGLLVVRYRAHIKSSISANGTIGLFLGANQIKNQYGAAIQLTTSTAAWEQVWTATGTNSLAQAGIETADSTTGQRLGEAWELFPAPGTYTLTAKFKAAAGSIAAKERKMWVSVVGY